MTGARLLMIGHDAATARALRDQFAARGVDVRVARDLAAAVAAHGTAPADVAIIGTRAGGATGMTVFRELQRQPAPPECIIVTDDGCVATAVEAMRAGAFDYVSGPCSVEDLAARVMLAATIRAAVAAREASPPPALEDVERRHIAAVLAQVQWHQGRAARILRISPKTLYRKIRAYGFRRPRRGRGEASR
ncbi:MAG: helix-turn-helix domain-containing protein [Gemmatimonadota bacterium]|nr:helix-turn-helix domain-containing protein [Gemmatimonadota bacterium]